MQTSLYEFEPKVFERQGWLGLPGSVPPLTPQEEKVLLTPLLEGLSTLFKLDLDTHPNLSRDPCIFPPGSAPALDEMAALFIGASNADRLANSAATLGIVTETVTTGGWVLTTDAVTEILPQVAAYCAALPADAPVVIYCLDNSSFCCADSDGQLSAISKQNDGVFHVIGEIVVVHEVTLAATVTNLTPDHLDRYPSVDAYYAAKAWLLALTVGGVSCNAKDPSSQHTLMPAIVPGTATLHFDVAAGLDGIAVDDSAPGHLCLTVRHAGTVRTLNVDNPLIVGHHNRQNAAAAAAVAILSDISDEVIVAGLTAYAGIAHRLERVGVHRGVSWWNDSKATNVDATVTALRSFNGGVHLIVGGVGKGSSYAPLVDAARACVKAVYTIGADAPALQDAFAGSGIDIRACGTLQGACTAAAAVAVAGDHVVLSPACASFDQFRDYTHRGAEFRICFAAAQGEP